MLLAAGAVALRPPEMRIYQFLVARNVEMLVSAIVANERLVVVGIAQVVNEWRDIPLEPIA